MAIFVRYFLMVIIFEMMALGAFHSDIISTSSSVSTNIVQSSSTLEKSKELKPFAVDIFSVFETLEIIESSEEDNIENYATAISGFITSSFENIFYFPQSATLRYGIRQKCAKYILFHCIKIPFLN